jgi:hypothetical protein
MIPAAPAAGIEEQVAEFLSSLLAERGLAHNTIAAYRRDLAAYTRYLTGRAPSPELVSAFVSTLQRSGRAATTIARHVASLRGFHRFLVSEGLADTNPTILIESPRRPRPLPKALTVVEVARLLDAPAPATTAGRRAASSRFMYATGPRRRDHTSTSGPRPRRAACSPGRATATDRPRGVCGQRGGPSLSFPTGRRCDPPDRGRPSSRACVAGGSPVRRCGRSSGRTPGGPGSASNRCHPTFCGTAQRPRWWRRVIQPSRRCWVTLAFDLSLHRVSPRHLLEVYTDSPRGERHHGHSQGHQGTSV